MPAAQQPLWPSRRRACALLTATTAAGAGATAAAIRGWLL